MRGRTLTVRTIALVGAASAAIHQLRYAIGFGAAAPHALASHAHGYLGLALPGIATAALIAIAAALMRVAGRPVSPTRSHASLPQLWLGCTLALAAIFSVQETLEGASAVAGGGWIGLMLALPSGLLVALALRGAETAEIRVVAAMPLIRVVSSATTAVGPRRRPGRLPDLRLGARAPPPPSFVV